MTDSSRVDLDAQAKLSKNYRDVGEWVIADDLDALIAELRASRKVVEAAREDVRWLMQAVLDRSEWTAPDSCPEHQCEFHTNPKKGACSFHEGWFGIAARHGLLEWLEPELDSHEQ